MFHFRNVPPNIPSKDSEFGLWPKFIYIYFVTRYACLGLEGIKKYFRCDNEIGSI